MKIKKKTSIPCPVSKQILLYGFFAVFCQLVFMVLNINLLLTSHSMDFVRYTYIPYLEYPIVSVALIIGGAFIVDYVTIKL